MTLTGSTIPSRSTELDPGMQVVLDEVARWAPPAPGADPVLAARETAERFVQWSRPAVLVDSIEDLYVQGASSEFRVRIYRPGPEPTQPVLYIHGGAWSAGSIELADRFCRRLCAGSKCIVASVDYRLAPDEPYPAGLDDCAETLVWLDIERDRLGSDGSDPIVAGESAGANLAAALCLRARAGDVRPIARQVLICPVLGDDFATDSHRRWGSGEFLVSSSALADAWQMYLAGRHVDPFAAPLRVHDLSGLPPALIVAAGCDPLHDDGTRFARRLSAAGGPVGIIEAPGLLHGFIYMDGVSAAAAQLVDRICTLHPTDKNSEA